jgi:hypothetical protein
VTSVVVDENYLEEFELTELGEHVIQAARAASGHLGRRAGELFEPLAARRQAISAMSGVVVDAPDFGDALAAIRSAAQAADGIVPMVRGESKHANKTGRSPQ